MFPVYSSGCNHLSIVCRCGARHKLGKLRPIGRRVVHLYLAGPTWCCSSSKVQTRIERVKEQELTERQLIRFTPNKRPKTGRCSAHRPMTTGAIYTPNEASTAETFGKIDFVWRYENINFILSTPYFLFPTYTTNPYIPTSGGSLWEQKGDWLYTAASTDVEIPEPLRPNSTSVSENRCRTQRWKGRQQQKGKQ